MIDSGTATARLPALILMPGGLEAEPLSTGGDRSIPVVLASEPAAGPPAATPEHPALWRLGLALSAGLHVICLSLIWPSARNDLPPAPPTAIPIVIALAPAAGGTGAQSAPPLAEEQSAAEEEAPAALDEPSSPHEIPRPDVREVAPAPPSVAEPAAPGAEGEVVEFAPRPELAAPVAPRPQATVETAAAAELVPPPPVKPQPPARKADAPARASGAPAAPPSAAATLAAAPDSAPTGGAGSAPIPAPAAGGDPAAASAGIDYRALLAGWLQKHHEYPARARRRNLSGTVLVGFTVDRSGRLLAYEVIESSGHAVLDDAALATLKRAAPLPAIPPDLGAPQFTAAVAMEFILK